MKNLKEEIQSDESIFKSGNLIKAEENTRKLILENPKVAFLYNLLGLILAEQKRFEEAELTRSLLGHSCFSRICTSSPSLRGFSSLLLFCPYINILGMGSSEK